MFYFGRKTRIHKLKCLTNLFTKINLDITSSKSGPEKNFLRAKKKCRQLQQTVCAKLCACT